MSDTSLSDHKQIILNINLDYVQNPNQSYKQVLNYQHFLNNPDIKNNIDSCKDFSELASYLHSVILANTERHEVKMSTKNQAVMNGELMKLWKKREYVYKLYKKPRYSNDVQLKLKLTELQYSIKRLKKKMQRDSLQLKIEKCTNDPKKFWSIVVNRDILRKNSTERSCGIRINDQSCFNKQDIANHFNHFFTTIAISCNQNIHQSYQIDYYPNKTTSQFKLANTNTSNMEELIDALNLNAAVGHDQISNEFLSIC